MYNGQLLQDAFVNNLFSKGNGYFVDIGAGTGGLRGNPISFYSNTFYLEHFKNWAGIAIDYDKEYINQATIERKCRCVCSDLMRDNINEILNNNGCPSLVDYLSFDVDDATDKVFDELDFEKYEFKIITFEHNIFQVRTDVQNHTIDHKNKVQSLYEKSRKKFDQLGYQRMCGDVNLRGYGSVEDWYINPRYIDDTRRYHDLDCEEIIKSMENSK